ncbi:hypothetical protein L7F22_062546 [Adiantum nelumboides]|nr:hypothetical protein [Adiantum nelumboides]
MIATILMGSAYTTPHISVLSLATVYRRCNADHRQSSLLKILRRFRGNFFLMDVQVFSSVHVQSLHRLLKHKYDSGSSWHRLLALQRSLCSLPLPLPSRVSILPNFHFSASSFAPQPIEHKGFCLKITKRCCLPLCMQWNLNSPTRILMGLHHSLDHGKP